MYKCLFVNVGSGLEKHVRAILALNIFHFLRSFLVGLIRELARVWVR